ncbi:DUF2807 domain-containing protein [uncultured Alistipes sp.]|jgi:hypothetical protein|uniref:GIN domain-containing protein n=1 Tax=uncultured Alistipes sp. TaxID=538949 RepID=UPI0025FC8AF0|nr:DUF2807 domain-containing protein [uncultured Alistipes sp.]
MKQFLLFLYALLFAMTGRSAPADNERSAPAAQIRTATYAIDDEIDLALAVARKAVRTTEREIDQAMAEVGKAIGESAREVELAIAEARAAIDAAEWSDMKSQSLEELNKAAHEQVVRELGLTSRQRKEFDPIYKAYREALDKAIDADANAAATDEASQKRSLKAKLSNISATAQVKRDYVDKFAKVLTAEQIRQLYNTEGNIGTSIKRSDANRRRSGKLKGSGRMASQDRGAAGNYSSLTVGHGISVVISPTAKSIVLTADDNVIDYVDIKLNGTALEMKVNANSTENISISAVIPASASLSKISATAYSKIDCKMPLRGPSVKITAQSGASVDVARIEADIVGLEVGSYGKFTGDIRATDCGLIVASGASAKTNIECAGICNLSASSYGKFTGNIKAATLKAEIPSGAKVNGSLTAIEKLTLSVTSYGKFDGAMHAQEAKIVANSGGSINGDFSGGSFDATANSYGKIYLKGSGTAASGKVNLASGGVFEAPDVRVGNYTINASSYGKANVYCTQKMTTSTTSGGQVRYDGNCTVESRSESVRRR